MQLYFKELGGGEPLVMLHGLFGSSDNWMQVAPKLAEKFHIFLLNLRNHGQSPHSSETNYPVMADDVAEFLGARNLESANILGHSLGGKVAMQFALNFPARVKKLVVVDMAPRAYAPEHNEIFSALLELDLKTFQSRSQIEDTLSPKIPSLSLRRFLLKNLGRNAPGSFRWKINLHGLAESYPQLGKALNAEISFAKPALFLRGGKSDYVRMEDESGIRELFPLAEIRTIAGVNHWVHADSPKEFVRLVLNFL